jgi:mono/diheme cytochrome c family protein
MKRISFILFTVGLLSACGAGKDKTNVEVIQGMMDQVSMKSQDYDAERKEASNRMPPDHTLPRNFKPYAYRGGNPLTAEANLNNPLAKEELLERGTDRYRIYCGVCHGEKGDGQGPVATKMAVRPPSLLSDKVKNFRDGRIFHIISDGQGVMQSYASQVPRFEDRWAIVNHIRRLQKGE